MYLISNGDSGDIDVLTEDESGNFLQKDGKVFTSTSQSNQSKKFNFTSNEPETKLLKITKKVRNGKVLKEEITIDDEKTFKWESNSE
ncbi:hypothetical protein BZARG_03355 [Bizionia argentinensis JUB59]|uniref:Uncharacterized protein n=1 Tax=Bizionia argentinensis JUB59 TaxID=1046627 RepID=A0A4U8UHS6_9FLAO|nr:hypothetical protein [Bizionia argentinensis]TLG99034.1 hypothetical protein BZARG_03355 [Bizionia argentinensis JUB59]